MWRKKINIIWTLVNLALGGCTATAVAENQADWLKSFQLVEGQYLSDVESEYCPSGDFFWVIDPDGYASLNVGQRKSYMHFGRGAMRQERQQGQCTITYQSSRQGRDTISYDYDGNCDNGKLLVKYKETLQVKGASLIFTHKGNLAPQDFSCTLIRRHAFTPRELKELRGGFFDFWDLSAVPTGK